ncbi:GIY-YIG nuclease family protein [Burkholderia ambifaria]|uniref:Excinuclease ABC C subunit domain protein n=1 Tax=Burkholderia ambifaria MEX-5 TaxID=396597 RepID=B1T741_9BURK|nr:GIY-YIG nuclease family protein [Burkholderia ambifaria]EDT40611.1 Excinuclease ABC C subunit domain protein [Burkholderia ambifaria MEX-5]
MSWFLYLIECADDSVYTGITTDVAARFDEHASGKGARYTRSRKPRAVLASFPLPDRSIASRAEYWVKRLTAAQKRELAAGIRTLESVLPAGMSIDGSAEAAGVQAGSCGRKKAKGKEARGDDAASPAATKRPLKQAAKSGNDGKAAKSVKSGKAAQAPTTARAAPARKRAKTGDAPEVKKVAPRGKPATNAAQQRKAPAAGGKSVTNERPDTASAPARGRAATRKAATEAVAATAAPVAAARRATGAKRAKSAPNVAALPAAARARKKTAARAAQRTKQNRAAS